MLVLNNFFRIGKDSGRQKIQCLCFFTRGSEPLLLFHLLGRSLGSGSRLAQTIISLGDLHAGHHLHGPGPRNLGRSRCSAWRGGDEPGDCRHPGRLRGASWSTRMCWSGNPSRWSQDGKESPASEVVDVCVKAVTHAAICMFAVMILVARGFHKC